MRKITTLLVLLFILLFQNTIAQSSAAERKIKRLETQRERVQKQEKDALKQEVKDIAQRLDRGDISAERAQELKEGVAKKRAMNIENRLAIIDNNIALLKRNEDYFISKDLDSLEWGTRLKLSIGGEDGEETTIFGIRFDDNRERPVKYDRRTYSDFVLAIGLNNSIIDDQSLDDSPYKIGGSRFFEMGWQWRTRVFKNSNWLRFHYGLSFQFNGLKPVDNQYFVIDGDETVLQEFPLELNKSKLRMDNLVFPIHFEFGPSKYYQSEEKIRYSLNRQFRMGIGGYGGFNIGTRQKLKYSENGDNIKEKLKRDYNTSNLIYGLSAYVGFDNTLLYCKYDLNTIFTDNPIEQRNISLGLRFDID